jgi:hypothetical protein
MVMTSPAGVGGSQKGGVLGGRASVVAPTRPPTGVVPDGPLAW